ncbi:MAG: M48 family metalloprotease [Armatimonadia bacterium]
MNINRRLHLLTVVALGLLTMALLVGCNEDDIERSLGRQTSAAVEEEFGVNRDPVLGEWTNSLGQRLVGQCGRQNIAYSFKVVNTDMVNAFAAPWGYVYVTQGMLGFAKSEDEVAFIMSHEIGHVAHRDSIKSVKKNILFSIGAALLGQKNEMMGNVAGLGAGMLLMHYSRSDEGDADVAGSTYAYGAGYDPAGGIDFFDRLQKELEKDRPSSLETLFLTHPPTANRIAAEKARPEMNLKNPVVASRIGRGYARRYAYATASKFYKMAIETKPEAVETRLTLAEAYEKQGLYGLAQSEFQAVLQRDPQNSFATHGLQALAPGTQRYTALKPAEQQQAGVAASYAVVLEGEAQALVQSSREHARTSHTAVSGASGIARQSIAGMMELGDAQKELTERGKEAFLTANAAVSKANDAAFGLEGCSEDVTRISDLLKADAAAIRVALQQASAGSGAAGDVAVYQRALAETQRATRQLNEAMALTTAAQPLVQQATRRGNETVAALTRMTNDKAPDKQLYPVKQTAQETLAAAQAATEAVGKVKKVTLLAESRALLAKLNLAALGASPSVREVYDGMVAHYCNVKPGEVNSLRGQGLGYGDAAFVLIASRAQRTAPASYVPMISGSGLIESLRGQGVSLEGPVALLRFLSNSIEREVAAR